MAFFKPKDKVFSGLDIGSSSTKLIKLKAAQGRYELVNFCIEPAPLDISEALKKIKQEQGVDAVNISFSGSSTVIRYAQFLKMSLEELRQALKFEAQKHIPFSVNDVYLDGCILKDGLADNKMLVLIAAVKKEIMSQRLKAFNDAGIRVNSASLDSIAVVNAFNRVFTQENPQEQKAVALLNVGSAATNLSIIENRVPRLSRDIHMAGNAFTQKIADMLALEFKAAEGLKVKPDSERAQKVNAAVETVLSSLATEVRTSFDFYESQSASAVAKIFLSGGSSAFAGLKDMLSNLLNVEVEHWDALKGIELAKNIDPQQVRDNAGQLAVAVGLAL